MCNGQKHMETFRNNKQNSIMEATTWFCAYCQDNHDWISEFSLVMQETFILEALDYDIDIPCTVQWEVCCGSLRQQVSTSLNDDLFT